MSVCVYAGDSRDIMVLFFSCSSPKQKKQQKLNKRQKKTNEVEGNNNYKFKIKIISWNE